MYMVWFEPVIETKIDEITQECDKQFENDFKRFIYLLDEIKSQCDKDISNKIMELECIYNGNRNQVVKKTYLHAFKDGVEIAKSFYK